MLARPGLTLPLAVYLRILILGEFLEPHGEPVCRLPPPPHASHSKTQPPMSPAPRVTPPDTKIKYIKTSKGKCNI